MNCILGRDNYSTIDCIEIDKEIFDVPIEIGDAFVDFFGEVASDLRKKIPHSDENFNSSIPVNPHSLSIFNPVTVTEVMETIQSLKSNSTLSKIPSKFIKLCSPYLADILANLFNECISKSYFPTMFKLADIEAILKGGNKKILSNYRPISLLHIINKIFEKLLYKRLYAFFEEHNLISPNQYGFLKGRSTTEANIQLLHYSLPAISHENYTMSVYLDLSKAFDCVDHSLLLDKLEKYGVRGNALKLINSYLSERRQRVRIKKTFSKERHCPVGVPQGSCLGPLFYLIYANAVNNVLNEVNVINYADDTVLILYGNNIEEMTNIMNRALSIISKWYIFNFLTINPSKSKCVIFSNRRSPFSATLNLNNEVIKINQIINYLDISMDNKLSFSPHLEEVNKKLSQIRGITWKITYKFDINAAKTFYYAFVYSVVSYGISAWGGILMTHECSRTFTLFRRIILNLFSWHFPECDFNTIRTKLGLLSLMSIYKLNAMVSFYKITKSNVASAITFETIEPMYGLRNQAEFKVPLPRTNVLKTHFYYRMPHIWNTIPSEIRNSLDIDKFKHSYKSHLLSES